MVNVHCDEKQTLSTIHQSLLLLPPQNIRHAKTTYNKINRVVKGVAADICCFPCCSVEGGYCARRDAFFV